MPALRRIDTHHHVLPPRYLTQAAEHIRAVTHAYFPRLLEWTPAKALAVMDDAGIETAVASMSTPGVWFGNADETRALSRDFNEYGARLVRDHKRRFGLFAILPLPDVDASLREIEYVFDVLDADGIGLMTCCDDKWPGDPVFAPVWDELQRRKAVVYFHPTAASFLTKVIPNVPPPTIEFPFDTTRAIVSLLFSGTLSRCPDIRFICSHAGGALPMVAARIVGVTTVRPDLAEKVPNGVMHELEKLYYDLAGASNAVAF